MVSNNTGSDNRIDREHNKEVLLAEKIIAAAQDKIVGGMRFMDSAVFALKGVCLGDAAVNTLMTDGSKLYYNPRVIFDRAEHGLSCFTHDYMHILLHCVFKHYFVTGRVNMRYWNLAADIAVEELIESLGLSCFNTPASSERRDELHKIRIKRGRLSADRLYRSFLNDPPIEAEINTMTDLFTVDDHRFWYRDVHHSIDMADSEVSDSSDVKRECNRDADLYDKNSDYDSSPDDINELEIERVDEADANDGNADGAALRADQDWDKIRDMVKTALEMDDSGFGEAGGSMQKELRRAEEKQVDYSAFLRKFAAMHETLKIDDNAFDYIMYTYGLERYKDMPLIEPLEYRDEKNIRDLVIAIDTSGSTDGELVKKFVDKSFEILGSSEIFGNRFNIHVIQCDAEIQDDTVLRTREDVNSFLQNIEIKGLGGTDFRPVFSYINELIQHKEIRNLRGLLYFTDGKGTYPKCKPPYDTAFIFADDEAYSDDVPAWAMKVYFDE